MKLDDLINIHKKYLHITEENEKIIKLLYASVFANIRIDDLPVWIILIGNPSSGKTTLVSSMFDNKFIYPISTLTPASMLSAYKDGGESLLSKVNNKVMIIKDFSAITELNSDMRNYLFSLLRDAYDGEIKRATGKFVIEFKGKFGIIACATFSIEVYKKLEGILGERFIHIKMGRNNKNDIEKAIQKAKDNIDKKKIIDSELRKAGNDYINYIVSQQVDVDKVKITESEHKYIFEIAEAIVKLRAGVVRDSYTKEIIHPAEPTEEPQRLYKQLSQILISLKCIDYIDKYSNNISNVEILLKILCDSISVSRLKVLQAIIQLGTDNLDIISKQVKLSRSYLARIIEDLEYLEIISKSINGEYEIKDDVIRDAIKINYGIKPTYTTNGNKNNNNNNELGDKNEIKLF